MCKDFIKCSARSFQLRENLVAKLNWETLPWRVECGYSESSNTLTLRIFLLGVNYS
jgi:hypothetical protein